MIRSENRGHDRADDIEPQCSMRVGRGRMRPYAGGDEKGVLLADGGTKNSGRERDVHPIDEIKKDPSKSLRIDYPDGSVEAMIWDPDDSLLWGSMDGKGPFPLYEPDARTVCEKYNVTVRGERSLDTDSDREMRTDGGIDDHRRAPIPDYHFDETDTVAYRLHVHPAAKKEFGEVPPEEHRALDRIIEDASYSNQPSAADGMKLLEGADLMRARAGNYRALIGFDRPDLVVVLVGKRKRVYDRLETAERRMMEFSGRVVP